MDMENFKKQSQTNNRDPSLLMKAVRYDVSIWPKRSSILVVCLDVIVNNTHFWIQNELMAQVST